MAKLNEDAAAELPLNDERVEVPKKLNRHVTIALRHLNVQREKLLTKRADLTKQIDEIDKAILALE